MGYLPDRKARTIFITGSTIEHHGKRSKIIIESRPEFAIIKLAGTRTLLPIAWEAIYQVAVEHHEANLRAEEEAKRQSGKRRGAKTK